MRRRMRPGGGRQVALTIQALGARGDGIAELHGRPVFVPFTLPGERVLVRLTGTHAGGLSAEALELRAAGPGRIEPPCPHFGRCGGCAVQHLADAPYAAWKQALVPQALARRGLDAVAVRPLRRVPAGSRRRATFAAVRRGDGVTVGFHEARSGAVVELEQCLVVTPGLLTLLPPLRAALCALLRPGELADVTATQTETGLDVLLVSRATPGLAARQALAGFAEQADLARLSWAERPTAGAALLPEPLAARRAPRLVFAGVPVEPPPGGFVQPTAEGEAALVEAVLAYLPEKPGRIADLHAGCGTFTFPLSTRGRVHAVEGDAAALAALWAAARRARLAGRVTVEQRDLARAPLAGAELEGYDAVLFDPPRSGARAQAMALADARVATVIAVSCNSSSFARDARILVDGGLALIEVQPLDQFPWTGHVELVGLFRR